MAGSADHFIDLRMDELMAKAVAEIKAGHADYALELISDEIERISGYPASDFLGADARRTIMSIICAEDREAVLKKAQNAVDDGQPFNLEYRIERPDGELRWVLDRGHRVKGPRGEEWMDGAIFDITERRENEEALRRHEVERARLKELRASQARIIEAADAARDHRVHDLDERFVAGEEAVPPGEQVALEPSLAHVLTEHLHPPAGA